MRTILLASAALFTLTCSVPASAQAPDAGVATDTPASTGDAAPVPAPPPMHRRHQAAGAADGSGQFAHEPGTGQSGPASTKASNISGSDSSSEIAPHFPQPGGGMNAGPWNYLRAADRALAAHRTGEAQQALEMAETRLLDRSTPVGQAGQPSQSPEIMQVNQARQALGAGDIAGARSAIRTALASAPHAGRGDGGMGNEGAGDAGTSPGMMQPGMAHPGMMQPGMAQPGMMQPGMAQPGMMQPGMAQPGMMQPGMAQPGMMQPGMAQPGMMQPGMTQPGMMQPGMTPGGMSGPGQAGGAAGGGAVDSAGGAR